MQFNKPLGGFGLPSFADGPFGTSQRPQNPFELPPVSQVPGEFPRPGMDEGPDEGPDEQQSVPVQSQLPGSLKPRSSNPFAKDNMAQTLLSIGQGFLGSNSFWEGLGAASGAV